VVLDPFCWRRDSFLFGWFFSAPPPSPLSSVGIFRFFLPLSQFQTSQCAAFSQAWIYYVLQFPRINLKLSVSPQIFPSPLIISPLSSPLLFPLPSSSNTGTLAYLAVWSDNYSSQDCPFCNELHFLVSCTFLFFELRSLIFFLFFVLFTPFFPPPMASTPVSGTLFLVFRPLSLKGTEYFLFFAPSLNPIFVFRPNTFSQWFDFPRIYPPPPRPWLLTKLHMLRKFLFGCFPLLLGF